MTRADISAVVVTRGDRDITQVLDSLKDFGELIVWNNAKECRDCKVLGRFVGAALAHNDTIYVQDDDCLVDTEALAALFVPDEIVCNMPLIRRAEYRDTGISLIGFGTIFPISATCVIEDYTEVHGCDELLMRECDRVFTFLNRDLITQVEVQMEHLPYAFGADRMGRESRHRTDYLEIRKRLKSLEAARLAS